MTRLKLQVEIRANVVIELLDSLAKIANKGADLELEKKLDKKHRARPLNPGDQVTLYRPASKRAKTACYGREFE